ncbi:MAG: hypothetical protein WD187_00305 [Candidatus Woykebacteria bacterium]
MVVVLAVLAGAFATTSSTEAAKPQWVTFPWGTVCLLRYTERDGDVVSMVGRLPTFSLRYIEREGWDMINFYNEAGLIPIRSVQIKPCSLVLTNP